MIFVGNDFLPRDKFFIIKVTNNILWIVLYSLQYRVLIKYCVILKLLNILDSGPVSVCTVYWLSQRTKWSSPDLTELKYFREKTQYLLNTLYFYFEK